MSSTSRRSIRSELYFVWRDDNDNPLLPVIASIARDLAGGA
jgi:hypothetical protein